MMEPQVLATRGMYLNGNLEGALRKAQDVLRQTPEDSGLQLLVCRWVPFSSGKYGAACTL
jgi:tetratricopeptide repeat protein 21B